MNSPGVSRDTPGELRWPPGPQEIKTGEPAKCAGGATAPSAQQAFDHRCRGRSSCGQVRYLPEGRLSMVGLLLPRTNAFRPGWPDCGRCKDNFLLAREVREPGQLKTQILVKSQRAPTRQKTYSTSMPKERWLFVGVDPSDSKKARASELSARTSARISQGLLGK